MKNLFDKGFSGDIKSLERAFEYGINLRNSLMAQNMYQILNRKDQKGNPVCIKALMFVGGLHLAEDVIMPMGRKKYQSIASHPILKNYSQTAHEILDCNNLRSPISSTENINQCDQFKSPQMTSVSIEDIFNPGKFISIGFSPSFSQIAGSQVLTSPKIQYNIMVLARVPRGEIRPACSSSK